MVELPPPQPRALATVSPTRANDLLACPYRVAFQLDTRFDDLRRPSPASLLGTIAHRILEASLRGRLQIPKDEHQATRELEELWNKFVTAAASQLAASWAPSVTPHPEDWPGYHLVQTRVLRRVLRTMQGSGARPSAPIGALEMLLEDPASGLSGRPDRVERSRTGTRVIDLKTSLRQGQPTDAQRRQLLLYAYLVARQEGSWPTEMAIEDLAGRQWSEPVDTAEAEELVATVVIARTSFERSRLAETLDEEARPDPDTCRGCQSRPVCRPYWDSLEISWDQGCVAGQPTRATTGRIDFRVDRPIEAAGQIWTIGAVPQGFEAPDSFTLVDAERTANEQHLRWKWTTVTWPPQRPASSGRGSRDANGHDEDQDAIGAFGATLPPTRK